MLVALTFSPDECLKFRLKRTPRGVSHVYQPALQLMSASLPVVYKYELHHLVESTRLSLSIGDRILARIRLDISAIAMRWRRSESWLLDHENIPLMDM